MALTQIQLYVPEKDRDEIDSLVKNDEYASRAEFVRNAIKEKLERRRCT
jgi:Arc/MetJ-type ribon-helix-helix transcriptional regulator